MISAKILADSIDKRNNRLSTLELVFPRFILPELLTHRLFSRNSSSSRAIPAKKMIKNVIENPFIPIAWQKAHKGMQGTEYATYPDTQDFINLWLEARDNAVNTVELMQTGNVKATKQLCNRLLEPFLWHKVILTATEFDNFFNLRCPQYEQRTSWGTFKKRSRKEYLSQVGLPDKPDNYKDWTDLDWLKINKGQGEIHISLLAEAMWDAMNESTPKLLNPGEWHIPFGDNIDDQRIREHHFSNKLYEDSLRIDTSLTLTAKIKIASARCARTSYQTFGDNPEINYEKDIELHDGLSEDKHMSPFEHVAKCMDDEEYNGFNHGEPVYENNKAIRHIGKSEFGWCNNFRGFIQYRYLIEQNMMI